MAVDIATGSSVTLAYQEETAYGTLPSTGTFRFTPLTGESLTFSKDSITSNNINSTRQVSDVIQTGFNVSGGIEIELAGKTFDEMMEGALWNRWSTAVDEDFSTGELTVVAATRTITSTRGSAPTLQTDLSTGQFIRISGMDDAGNNGVFQIESITSETVFIVLDPDSVLTNGSTGTSGRLAGSMLRNGSTSISYVFEKAFNDLTTPQYFYFLGCMVNALSLSMQSSSIVTGSFDFMGTTSSTYDTGTESTGAIVASVGNNILNAVSHIGGVRIDSALQSASDIYFQGIDLSLANNLRGVQAIGTVGNITVSPGQLEATGTMNAYFSDPTMYGKFTGDTEFSLSYEIIDESGEGYVFSFPRVTITADDLPTSGNDSDIVENMTWSAMMSASTNIAPSITMQIDRFYSDYTDVPDA